MTYKAFRTIKALTQLVGALAGAAAIYLGADPLLSLLLITMMVSGPEAVEVFLSDAQE